MFVVPTLCAVTVHLHNDLLQSYNEYLELIDDSTFALAAIVEPITYAYHSDGTLHPDTAMYAGLPSIAAPVNVPRVSHTVKAESSDLSYAV